MLRMRTSTAILLLMALPASADTLADIRATLGRFAATTPIHGSLDVSSSQQSSEEDAADVGKVIVQFDASAGGVQVTLPRNVVSQAAQEARSEAMDPSHQTPARNALLRIRTLHVAELANAADPLLTLLENAKIVETKPSMYKGKPAHTVTFTITPRLTKTQSKHLKKLARRLTLFLGDDGVPVAADLTTTLSASLLLLSFENRQQESWTYVRAGDRLVATRYEQTQSGSGLGQHTNQHVMEVITLQ